QQGASQAVTLIERKQCDRPTENVLAIDDEVCSEDDPGEQADDTAGQSTEKSEGPTECCAHISLDILEIDVLEKWDCPHFVGQGGEAVRPVGCHGPSIMEDGRQSKNQE